MSVQRNNRRILICPILPEQVVRKYKASFAANNFCQNLLSETDIFDKVFVTLPIRPVDSEDLCYSDNRIIPAYCSSFRESARLSRFAFIPEAWQMFGKIKRGDSIWYYNLAYTLAVLFILVKLFKPAVKQHIIILDYTPGRSGIKGAMESFLLWLINKSDGAIALTPNQIYTCRPIENLAGVVPNTERREPQIGEPNNKYLLSGVLNERIAQTSMVLKVFSELPQCELHITGTVDDDARIRIYANNYPNIIYHGTVPFEEYLRIMHSCTFQLSTRNPDYPENQCNFPSKIIETLLHNRIIISTINYPQLEGIKYFQTTSDPEYFKQNIDSISSISKGSLMEYANQGKKVAEMFSIKVWNDAMTKIETTDEGSNIFSRS